MVTYQEHTSGNLWQEIVETSQQKRALIVYITPATRCRIDFGLRMETRMSEAVAIM